MDIDYSKLLGIGYDSEAESTSFGLQLVAWQPPEPALSGAPPSQVSRIRRGRNQQYRGKFGAGKYASGYELKHFISHLNKQRAARRHNRIIESLATIVNGADVRGSKRKLTMQIVSKPASSTTSAGVIVKITKKLEKGNRYQRKIAFSKFLDLAYGQSLSNRALSVLHDVDICSVHRMRVSCACTYMINQARLLSALVAIAQREKPLACIQQLKWDDASVPCSADIDKSGRNVKSNWSILVCRARFILIWPCGKHVILRLVMPPVLLIGKGSAQDHYAIRYHPSFHLLNSLIDMLRSICEEYVVLWEADGAASNERLMTFWRTTLSEMAVDARCQNHATALIVIALMSLVYKDMFNRLYAMVAFMKNLGNLGRFHNALRTCITNSLEFHEVLETSQDRPSNDDLALNELISYVRTWTHRDSKRDRTRRASKKSSRFDKAETKFRAMWNGGCVCKRARHLCTNVSVARRQRHCQSRAHAAVKMSSVAIDLFWSVLPDEPLPNKWLKLWPALQFAAVGFFVFDLLPSAFKVAYAKLTFEEFQPGDLENCDPKLIQTLAYQQVNGRRHRDTVAFLEDDSAKSATMMMLVFGEVLRSLTMYWLGCLDTSKAMQSPPIFKILDKRRSPVYAWMQFLSHLMFDSTGGSRLRLIWMRMPCSSYLEFIEMYPDQVRLIRRHIHFVSAWIHRRHWIYFTHNDLWILVFADPNADPDMLALAVARWDSLRSCCHPPGLLRALKDRKLTSADLRSPKWRIILLGLARLLQLSTADVECKHAQNNHFTATSFHGIVASFINAEAKVCQTELAPSDNSERPSAIESLKHDPAVVDVQTGRRWKRAKSATELFKDDWIASQKSQGVTVNPAVKGMASQLDMA